MNDYWEYVVKLLEDGKIIKQTDNEDEAFEFCKDCPKPVKVVEVRTNKTIYHNCL